MSDRKKENLFAKLAVHNAKAARDDAAAAVEPPPEEEDTPPSPAPPAAVPSRRATKQQPEPTRGKRGNPDYCQANAYVPKSLRRAVEKALLDTDDLDYSSLVTDLLRKWLKSRGVAE